ncbi:hypothetical protein ASPVEDRAFT_866192 [Aspergillus versicolor CBS 583.65]|uniref:Uncharacterized protein n=1 Tax=Aspergillus versicolor CBS 583.65 TaxID=1036611 RepID=A0A1L9PVY7_ASPVE|nr:uncharacterized protein ASPVEDRAFT_866192 [Aspergillus versicolor CBS 583.65]OJJ05714.1 hypothetical protein ASPVEDRAFT_866192 [Aspergillus versicolor CBS 583.65]
MDGETRFSFFAFLFGFYIYFISFENCFLFLTLFIISFFMIGLLGRYLSRSPSLLALPLECASTMARHPSVSPDVSKLALPGSFFVPNLFIMLRRILVSVSRTLGESSWSTLEGALPVSSSRQTMSLSRLGISGDLGSVPRASHYAWVR